MKDAKEQFEKIKDDPDAKVIDMKGKRKREKDRKGKLEDEGEESPEDAELNKMFEGTPYYVKKGCLTRIIKHDYGNEYKTLTNFVVLPKAETTKDDGLTVDKYFTFSCRTSAGAELHDIVISAEKFVSMAWITANWGLQCNISPGSTNKDYLRHAIQSISNNVKNKTVYAHTGWRKVNGEYVFLYNGGAVGIDSISVELEGSLSRYSLPEKVDNYREAAEISYKTLFVAPLEITIPLLAITYLSPLNEFFKKCLREPAFVLWLLGKTGSRKSTLASLFLCHFGEFSNKNLPSSFKDTYNSIEKKGFLLKDVLTVIDDYYPVSSKVESQKMQTSAQEIMRGYGDRKGKDRMTSETSLRSAFIPRGNAIITGEDIPNIGQSATSRYLTVEIGKTDIDLEKLSYLQSNIKSLSLAMRGYIEWLLPYVNDFPDELKSDGVSDLPEYLRKNFDDYRTLARDDNQHGRFAEVTAWLYISFNFLLSYFKDVGVITEKDVLELREKCFTILQGLSDKQNRKMDEDKPAAKFITALSELLSTRQCYTIRFNESITTEHGFLGYRDDNYYYLYPETVYKWVVQFYSAQGELFPVGKITLLKHLESDGYIFTENKSGKPNRTPVKNINYKPTRLLWIKKDSLNIQ